jgi:type VI secretion system protein ImpM
MPALPPDSCVGLFGKLPARGDFVRENLPRDFTDAWDAWWLRGLVATQRRSREEWCAAWLEAPVWRFLLPPSLCGRNGVLGLWLPSVDKAGRYYPLTIAAVAPTDWAPYAGAMMDALTAWEQTGRDALEYDLAPLDLLPRIRAAFESRDLPGPSMDFAPDQATWWTDGGPRVAPRVERGTALPEGIRFATLIDDDWGSAVPSAGSITLSSGPGNVQP